MTLEVLIGGWGAMARCRASRGADNEEEEEEEEEGWSEGGAMVAREEGTVVRLKGRWLEGKAVPLVGRTAVGRTGACGVREVMRGVMSCRSAGVRRRGEAGRRGQRRGLY